MSSAVEAAYRKMQHDKLRQKFKNMLPVAFDGKQDSEHLEEDYKRLDKILASGANSESTRLHKLATIPDVGIEKQHELKKKHFPPNGATHDVETHIDNLIDSHLKTPNKNIAIDILKHINSSENFDHIDDLSSHGYLRKNIAMR